MTKADRLVAIVTGSGAGIGRAIAQRLARDGVYTVVADIDSNAADATVEQIHESGGDGTSAYCDVTDSQQIRELIGKVVADRGQLHVMVNNVGAPVIAALKDATDQQFQQQLQLNLASSFFGMREALAVMLPARRGSVINIASGAGLMGTPGLGLYAAAKAAIINMTQTAAVENARSGVRINSVVPGSISTDVMLDSLKLTPGAREAWEDGLVPGRMGEPDEIAKVVAFLAGDDSSYVNGAAIVVDGGLSVKLPSQPNPD